MVHARRVLTARHLNRALLARQLLLERAVLPFDEAVERMGALQDQYAPSLYVGLWSRVRDVRRDAVTRALEDRVLVQGSLMRVTIHVVSRREYWRYAAGIRDARRTWLLGLQPAAERDAWHAAQLDTAQRLRAALAGGPRSVKELGDLARGFVGNAGLWVDLVRVPPSGTWERRRADRLALAEAWVGPADATAEEGVAHVVLGYLRAFGPAPWRDIAAWAGVPVAELQRGGASLGLVALEDEAGRPLVDLPGADLPDPSTPAPVRFLPHWDALTLAHARRTGVLPEAHRARVYTSRNPASMGTVLADGRVVAGWRAVEGRILLEPFDAVDRRTRDQIEDERLALEAFHA